MTYRDEVQTRGSYLPRAVLLSYSQNDGIAPSINHPGD
jgi:hypothetical protein